MIKKILFFGLICCCSSTFSQTLSWVNQVSSTNFDADIFPVDNVVDNLGQNINYGNFRIEHDFDPGSSVFNLQTPPFVSNLFLQKLDAKGNFVWAKKIGGSSLIQAGNISVTNNNDIIITGVFEGTIDFDNGVGVNSLTSTGFTDVFIAKFGSNGDLIWVKQIKGNDFTFTGALFITDADDILIGGSYGGTVDFDPATNSDFSISVLGSAYDAYLLKLNSDGAFIYVKSLPSTYSSQIFSIATDNQNNIILGGSYSGLTDFDPDSINTFIISSTLLNPFALPPLDFFILKLDNNGSFLWAKSNGSFNTDEITSLVVNSTNEIIATGNFQGRVDFDDDPNDSTIAEALGQDIFFLKLSSTGEFIWVKTLKGDGFSFSSGLQIDNMDNLYGLGNFPGIVDFDLDTGVNNITANGSDIFILKLDQLGNTINRNILSGNGSETASAIFVNKTQNVFVLGYLENTIDFDPQVSVFNINKIGVSQKDMFAFKWSECSSNTSSTINASGCSYNLNSVNYSGNGSYFQTIPNSLNCDSLISLNLINSSTNTYLYERSCTGIFTLNGQNYTASGDYVQNNVNASGCDSNFYLNLQVGVSDSSSFPATACRFYITAQTFYTTSGIYTEIYKNASGCDSVVTIDLTIKPTYEILIQDTSCSPIVYDGVTYTTTGFYNIFLTSSLGCDSVIILDFTINQSTDDTLTIVSCGDYTFNGTIYSSSGFYTDSLVNNTGCDSIINLNLTVFPSTQTINSVSCGQFSYNGKTYTISGTYLDTLSQNGCLTITTLNVQINNSVLTTLTISACNSYVYNGNTYLASGIYPNNFTAINGCDSIVNLVLTISSNNLLVQQNRSELMAIATANTTYQWVSCPTFSILQNEINSTFTATTNGSYAVIASNGNCIDTSECFNVTTVGIYNPSFKNQFIKYFPNPFSSQLNLEIENPSRMTNVSIINALNQIVFENQYYNSKTIQLDLDKLSAGVYFVKVNSDDQFSSYFKVVKE